MENLRAYLNAMAPDEQAEFARLCGTTIRYLRKAISLRIRLGPLFCVGIERETCALITRKHLRPDDWHLIWPELVSARGYTNGQCGPSLE